MRTMKVTWAGQKPLHIGNEKPPVPRNPLGTLPSSSEKKTRTNIGSPIFLCYVCSIVNTKHIEALQQEK